MSTTPAPAPIAISRYVGYAWRIPAQMTDLDGAPLDISTWTIAGELYVPDQLAPSPIAARNIDVATASFEFYLAPEQTKDIIPHRLDSRGYPCRIMVTYTDAEGETYPYGLICILPLDPRTFVP
ncbi:hypothetical protein ABIE45_004522 [Methylobacterium sp. OAE515]|uniref:hypothetical protein n=1 Tax=Methylobacterium sp. OAE515 TaxID=2817895 RepID=UPI0017896BE2